MPRFSIRSLLLATTLIAIGLGLICISYKIPITLDREILQMAAIGLSQIVGVVLVGAGLGVPFNRPWSGAIIAVVFVMLLPILPTIPYPY